jgi:phosphoribosyl 1,2-cyclic phosphodiesterase
MEIFPLASGSTGNACLVRENHTAILIDAGIGPRLLNQRMRPHGVCLADLQACFFTHEHSDHVRALSTVTFPKTLTMISNRETWSAIHRQIPLAGAYPFQNLDIGEMMTIGDLAIQSLPVSHDGVSPVGYLIHSKQGECLLYATDMGVPAPWLPQAIAMADYVVLESNHDVQMLQHGPYPWYLKQRVASNQGHLSNVQAGSLLAEYLTPKTKQLYLAHLSKTNNTPTIALETVCNCLSKNGIDMNRLQIMAAAP